MAPGVSRQDARLDEWLKDAAPSPALRVWFGHKPENFEQFSNLYRLELDTDPAKQAPVQHLIEAAKSGRVTLLYAAKSPVINHAIVLQRYLLGKMA